MYNYLNLPPCAHLQRLGAPPPDRSGRCKHPPSRGGLPELNKEALSLCVPQPITQASGQRCAPVRGPLVGQGGAGGGAGAIGARVGGAVGEGR